MLEPLPLGPSADLDAPAGGSRAEALQARYDKILANPGNLDEFIRELDGIEKIADVLPKRVNADPHNLENGLAQLVLTVIDLLRKLMERQAIRRREGGSLSDEEVERLGQTFMKLEEKMKELKETFGLGIATSTATSARWSNCFEKCRAIEDRLQSVCQKTRDLALAMGTAGNDKEADPT